MDSKHFLTIFGQKNVIQAIEEKYLVAYWTFLVEDRYIYLKI